MPAPSHPLQLVLGLVVWSAWFVLLYGGLSVGCALAPPAPEAGTANWLNALLLLATLATTVLLTLWARSCWRAAGRSKDNGAQTRFITRIAAGVHLVAAAATLAVGLPTLALPPCV